MSWEIESVTEPVAIQDYHCQASDWIDNTRGWDEAEYDEADRSSLRKALAEGKKILKGTQYVKVSGKWEGSFAVFRARKDLQDICQKYELYPE